MQLSSRGVCGTWLPCALAIAVAIALAMPGDARAQLYRQVGPDGKVTFTDKPPAGVTPVPRPAAAAPAAPAPAASRAPAPATAAAPASVPARRWPPPPGDLRANPPLPTASQLVAQAQKGVQEADLEGSVSAQLGYEAMILKFRETCGRTSSPDTVRYSEALQGWRQRNSAVMKNVTEVLSSRYTPQKQAELRTMAQARTRAQLKPLAKADEERRVRWCNDTATSLASGGMDLTTEQAETLAGALPKAKR